MALCILATLLGGFVSAQTSEKTDTSIYLNGRIKIVMKEKDGEKKASSISITTAKTKKRQVIETEWGGFDIGFNNLIDRTDYNGADAFKQSSESFYQHMQPRPAKRDMDLRSGKSIQLNFTIVKQQISLYKHYVNVVYGITYDINNWSFSESISLRKSGDTYSGNLPGFIPGAFMTRDSVNYRKNRLVANYIQMPFLLRFESHPGNEKRNMYLSIGGFGAYLVRSHTKQIREGSDEKVKRFDDFILNKFQYGLQAEVGTRDLSLYYKQHLAPLFEYGYVQYPYSFGIRLSGM
jgi:hypothetical protein